jgi:hypothetical protein
VQLTHREGSIPEIWIHATSLENGKTLVSFFDDDEIDGWTEGYVTGFVLPDVLAASHGDNSADSSDCFEKRFSGSLPVFYSP